MPAFLRSAVGLSLLRILLFRALLPRVRGCKSPRCTAGGDFEAAEGDCRRVRILSLNLFRKWFLLLRLLES